MLRKELLMGYIAAANVALSFYLVASFLPIYLDLQGVSLTSIGLIFAFAAMVAGVLRFPIGTFTDKMGRRPLILLGAIGYPIFGIGVALASTTNQFITLKILIELFAAIFWTAYWAYLYDTIHRGKEGREISFSYIFVGTGAIIAPLFGGYIISQYGFSLLFYLAAIVGFVNLIFISFAVKEKPVKNTETIKQLEEDLLKEYTDIINIKKFRIYLTIGVLHNIIWAIWWVYMPIHLSNIGIGIMQIGFILALARLSDIVLAYPLGKLIDKVPSKYLIIPGFLLIWISGYAFLLSKQFIGLAASRMSMSAGYLFNWQPLMARLSHLTPRKEHGGTIGLFRAGCAIAIGLATITAGYFDNIYRIPAVLWVVSSFALVIAISLIFINSGIKEKGRTLLAKHHLVNLHEENGPGHKKLH